MVGSEGIYHARNFSKTNLSALSRASRILVASLANDGAEIDRLMSRIRSSQGICGGLGCELRMLRDLK